MDKLLIFTDGGSRGNPGPAAIGVVVGDREYCETLGNVTNNVAEYEAVVFALKKAKYLLGKEKIKHTEVIVNMDSELVAKQLNAEYKILEPDLQPLFLEIWNLKFDFPHLSFRHINRSQNSRADYLANKALDAKGDSLF